MDENEAVEATGSLLREGGGFVLAADDGRRLRLELGRTPVDLVAKRARVAGRLNRPDLVTVEEIGPA